MLVAFVRYSVKQLIDIEQDVYDTFDNVKVKAAINRRYSLLKEGKMTERVFLYFLVRTFMSILDISKDSAKEKIGDIIQYQIYKKINGDNYESENEDFISR